MVSLEGNKTKCHVEKLKMAAFGSFYRGYYVLDELLYGPLKDHFKVVGVASDDVREPYISSEVRVWQYPYLPAEELLVMSPHSSRRA